MGKQRAHRRRARRRAEGRKAEEGDMASNTGGYSPAKTLAKGAGTATGGAAGGGLGLLIIAALRSLGADIPAEAEAGIVWLCAVAVPTLARMINNYRKHGLGGIAGLYGCIAWAALAGLLLGGAAGCATTRTLPDGTVEVIRTVDPDQVDLWFSIADRVITRIDALDKPDPAEEARRAEWDQFRADLWRYVFDRALDVAAEPPEPPEPVAVTVPATAAEAAP